MKFWNVSSSLVLFNLFINYYILRRHSFFIEKKKKRKKKQTKRIEQNTKELVQSIFKILELSKIAADCYTSQEVASLMHKYKCKPNDKEQKWIQVDITFLTGVINPTNGIAFAKIPFKYDQKGEKNVTSASSGFYHSPSIICNHLG